MDFSQVTSCNHCPGCRYEFGKIKNNENERVSFFETSERDFPQPIETEKTIQTMSW